MKITNYAKITPQPLNPNQPPDFSHLDGITPLEITTLESLHSLLLGRFLSVNTSTTQKHSGESEYRFDFECSLTGMTQTHKYKSINYATVSTLYRKILKWKTRKTETFKLFPSPEFLLREAFLSDEYVTYR